MQALMHGPPQQEQMMPVSPDGRQLDPKQMAKTLRTELDQRRRIELSHSECLEITAHQLGHASWNVLAAKLDESALVDARATGASAKDDPSNKTTPGSSGPFATANLTVPVLRIFSVELATAFYVDFLGFGLDWGGPSDGPGTSFYGQVTSNGTTLHLTESTYDPYPGSTIGIWLQGVDALHNWLNARRSTVKILPPAVWVPAPEDVPWGRIMTVSDPFGNSLRFTEPTDRSEREALPDWSASRSGGQGSGGSTR